MTILISINGIKMDCEYHPNDFLATKAIHKGEDILPVLSASFSLASEINRLVREAHRKEYGE